MKNLSKILIAASLTTFVACNDDFENPVDEIQVTSGSADFSKYIALGNSLTSGITDGALFNSGQVNSYPNMLATQMMMAGGGSFTQPLMPDEIGGFSDILDQSGNQLYAGKYILKINPETGSMGPVQLDAETGFTAAIGGPFNNMGVPGTKSFHLSIPGYATLNPYFERFATIPATSILQDAIAQQPTFYSLWIGNNDVLSYATSGGVGEDRTGDANYPAYGMNDISDPVVVKSSIENILMSMNNIGAKGVIVNIPSITDIPYFTTVPYAPLSPSNSAYAAQIPSLNNLYGLLNQILAPAGRQITFSTDSASAVVIHDEELSDLGPYILAAASQHPDYAELAPLLAHLYGKARQATSEDLLVFTSQTVIGTSPASPSPANQYALSLVQELSTQFGLPATVVAQFCAPGLTYPLEDKWVLTNDEKQNVITATNAYNVIIRQLATDYDLAFVDAHKAMQDLSSQSGITYFGNTYTTTYVSGGAFSLDAVHLTGKGYAVVTNYFVDAINQKYGSTLKHVNPNNYPGVMIP